MKQSLRLEDGYSLANLNGGKSSKGSSLFLKCRMKFLYFERFFFIGLLFLIFIGCTKQEQSENKSVKSEFGFQDAMDQINKIIEKDPSYVIINSNEYESTESSGCQPGSAPQGYTCFTFQRLKTISLPEIAGCPACSTVYVGYTMRVCFNGGSPPIYNFTFWNLQTFPHTLCQDWWDCIGNLGAQEADRVIEAMNFAASQIVEEEEVNYFVNLNYPLCPLVYYSSDFLRQSCFNWCVYPILQAPYWAFEQLICGNKCCQRTRTFCKELNGTITISSPSYQIIGSYDCSATNPNLCNGFSYPCYDRPCDTP